MQEHEGRDEVFEQQSSPSVGAMLRAAREARGQTVESIARSLKLNPRYLEALEADTFDAFPAQPYVRVYIKTLAQHLGIDPHEVLNRYRRQLGVEGLENDEPGRTRVDLATVKPPVRRSSWPVTIGALLVLVAVALVVQRTHLAAPKAPAQTDTDSIGTPGVQSDSTAPAATEDNAAASDIDSAAPPTPAVRAEAVSPAPSRQPAVTAPTGPRTEVVPGSADSLVLVVSARRDSAWIQVFVDGSGWTNFVKPGRPRVFRARDSLNVQVGYNANILYELNGTPITPSTLKGVAMFRIDHDSITEWSSATWRRTFRNRTSSE